LSPRATRRRNLLAKRSDISTLERFPILARGDEFVLVLPTAPSAAIRRFIIERMMSPGMRAALATGLGRK
jgi:hypothetical protein